MTEASPKRSWFLALVALAMAASVVGLLVYAARSQNLYGLVAEIEALDAATGETLWKLERNATGHVRPFEQSSVYLMRDRDSLIALDNSGSVVWEASDRGAELVIPRGDYVWLSHGPAGTTQLSAEDGGVGWEKPGRFVGASDGLAALELSNPQRLAVVSLDSGEKLHQFRHRHKDSFALDHRDAARLRKGTLWLLSEDGTDRKVVEDLPERSWLKALRDGVAVVLHRAEAGPGLVLRGLDADTGEQLWRHTEPQSFNSYVNGDSIHISRPEGGERSIDIRTGAEVPSRAYWQESQTGETATLVAQARELVTVDASTRYFEHASTVYAIDPSSGEILWTHPGGFPDAATEGLAAFKGDDEVRLVAATSGDVVATVQRKGRTRVRAGGGRVLVGTGSEVQLIDQTGTKTTIFDAKARVDALSARYAVFSKDVVPNTKPKQVFIHDIETGTQIVTEPISFPFRAWFDGDELMIGGGAARLVVDPATGQIENLGPLPDEYPEPGDFESVLIALDGDLTKLRWSRNMGRAHTMAVVDGVVMLTSTRQRHLPQAGG